MRAFLTRQLKCKLEKKDHCSGSPGDAPEDDRKVVQRLLLEQLPQLCCSQHHHFIKSGSFAITVYTAFRLVEETEPDLATTGFIQVIGDPHTGEASRPRPIETIPFDPTTAAIANRKAITKHRHAASEYQICSSSHAGPDHFLHHTR